MTFNSNYHFGIPGCVSISSACDGELAQAIRKSDYVASETMKRCRAVASYDGKTAKYRTLYWEYFQRRVCREAGLPAPHQTGWKEPAGIWATEPKAVQARKAIKALNLPEGTSHRHIRRMYKYFYVVGYRPRNNCQYTGSKLITGHGYTLIRFN